VQELLLKAESTIFFKSLNMNNLNDNGESLGKLVLWFDLIDHKTPNHKKIVFGCAIEEADGTANEEITCYEFLEQLVKPLQESYELDVEIGASEVEHIITIKDNEMSKCQIYLELIDLFKENGCDITLRLKHNVVSYQQLIDLFEKEEEEEGREWGREHYKFLLKELGEGAVTADGIYMSDGLYLQADGSTWDDGRD